MTTKRLFSYAALRPAAFLLAALLTTACSKEPSEGPEPGQALRISFEVPDIEQTVEATKADAEALAEGTTVRIAAFYHGSDNPQTANLCKEVTYCLREGQLVPCLVDENGHFVEFGGQDMELLPYAYDFYAVSPALPLNADKCSVNVPQGIDFATSVTANQIVAGDKAITQPLAALIRRCAKVTFEVKRADDFSELTALSVRNLTVGGLQPTAANVALAGDVPAAVGSESYVLPGDVFTASGETSASAFAYLLPCSGSGRITFDYELEYALDGPTKSQTLNGSIASLKLDPGKSYTVTLTVKKQGPTMILGGGITADQQTDVGGW